MKGKTVLIIEDDDVLRHGLRIVLEGEGLTVLAARNGVEGLAFVSEHVPDLILSDLYMPEADGFLVLERIRRDPGTAALPVIIMSVDAAYSIVQKSFEYGASAFLSKPFKFGDLIRQIRHLLEEGEKQRESNP